MPRETPETLAAFVSQLTSRQQDLLAFIISLMPGDPDAADVLQKTNLVLWNKRETFKEEGNFIAWSFAIARFEVLNHLRKQKRARPLLLDSDLLDTLAAEAPATLNAADQRMRALEGCLGKLRPEDRELLEHRYQSGLCLDEFAKRAGRSVSALSVSLNRLRTLLRRCIVRQVSAEGGIR